MANLNHNIQFYIGQPNTGKSHDFKEEKLKDIFTNKANGTPFYSGVIYEQISVSGGEGNEFRGLQSSDIAISYDPVNNQILFGSLLKSIMRAISEPQNAHVYFLDDFHNQNISSLLSEFTPLLKTQNMYNGYNNKHIDINKIKSSNKYKTLFSSSMISVDDLINKWNKFIITLERLNKKQNKNVPASITTITNKITGQNIRLFFPDNFFLLGAANFNSKTLNIFADWQARAVISYKDPLAQYTSWAKNKSPKGINETEQTKLFNKINESIKTFLENNEFFDYKSVCFGYWGYEAPVDAVKLQNELINAFALVNASLKLHHRNEWINELGGIFISLIKEYNQNQNQTIFNKILSLGASEQLYHLGLYENSEH